jgi:hypothetical protein
MARGARGSLTVPDGNGYNKRAGLAAFFLWIWLTFNMLFPAYDPCFPSSMCHAAFSRTNGFEGENAGRHTVRVEFGRDTW